MNGAYLASIIIMWVVAIYAAEEMWRYRRKLRAAIAQAGADAPLADWCRHMSLTVWTHTGSVFQTTFAELQASEHAAFRNWNVPIQVSIWSDQVDDDFKAVVARTEDCG